MTDPLNCRHEGRRRKLFDNAAWNGIDFLEVSDDQLSLCVHFFGAVPRNITPANVRIGGGRRITGIVCKTVEIDSAHNPDLDDCLKIGLDRFGDFSTYRLCLVDAETGKPMAGLDPRYSGLDFTFKIGCPSDLDCQPDCGCPPQVLPEPDVNYLAKDYASFRQIILDRLALIMPEWRESHVPDIGVTLVELLAYAGDYLSYYQDAVATEAYLGTARRRISVRRHARLVDYRIHEGCNARAWVAVDTSADIPAMDAKDFYFITGFGGPASGGAITEASLEEVPSGSYEVFEPLPIGDGTSIAFAADHSTIRFHTWGDLDCCLAKGATQATLVDMASSAPPGGKPERILSLNLGDVLIFEEVIGPGTGNPADADPTHRHAVRLISVTQGMDELLGVPVVEIAWAPEDALPFSLCLSVRLPPPDCRWIADVSVARGNVVLVDHGRTVGEPLGPVGQTGKVSACSCEGSVIEETIVPARFTPDLKQGPLIFAEPVATGISATALLQRDPQNALPQLSLEETAGETGTGVVWTALYDLLESGGGDRNFVCEIDDEGDAHLRFGDGALGRQPVAGQTFAARYRIGHESEGNVGRDTITYLVIRNGLLDAGTIAPRNPLPATGGTARQPVAVAKLLAPHAFRDIRERAVIASDYAELAERNPALEGASAALQWTGSWYEAHVAIDPLHSEQPSQQLLNEIDCDLQKFRRIGHDLRVAPAKYVPLRLVLEVCVLPGHVRGEVKAELMKVFGTGRLANGTLGFFNPDNLVFGGGIYLSRIVSAAMAVSGVATVKVTSFTRFGLIDESALASGVLELAACEVAMCDGDPNFPENGSVTFIMEGGR